MKLVRYGRPGAEKPGILDEAGHLRDLSDVVDDVGPNLLGATALKRLRRIRSETLPLAKGRPRLGCPLSGIGKIVCIGLNYKDHAAEVGLPLPQEPTVFLKATSAVSGPDDAIVRPPEAGKLDYEAELVAVIGTSVRYVDERKAAASVAGFCLMIDVSERGFQMERGGTTTKGKSCDSFAPIGPWFVTADEVPDPQRLPLWTKVNGALRQNGNTRDMVFTVPALIAYVSRFMSLQPGDLLATGTPAGVGHGAKPPRYLVPGDIVEIGSDPLGVQRHSVVDRAAQK